MKFVSKIYGGSNKAVLVLIPAKIKKQLQLQKGDYLEVEITPLQLTKK